MIKRLIYSLLRINQRFVVSCNHEGSYKDLYYIVDAKTKNDAIRKVVDYDKESIKHKVKSTINEDIFISRSETFYVYMIATPERHILITAPEDTIYNIIKSKHRFSLGIFGIYVYKISGML